MLILHYYIIPVLPFSTSSSKQINSTTQVILLFLPITHSLSLSPQFINFYVQPTVQSLPSYIKDTNHFLVILPYNILLATIDITSLYTTSHILMVSLPLRNSYTNILTSPALLHHSFYPLPISCKPNTTSPLTCSIIFGLRTQPWEPG